MVQVGAGVGSAVGQWLGLSERKLRVLLAAGVAAGIAATFNAPIAGVLFAVEVLLGELSVVTFSPIVVASVAATLLSHRFWGDVPVFRADAGFRLASLLELPVHAALGGLAAFVSVLFIETMDRTEVLFERLRIPGALKPALGGLAVGGLALLSPAILGVGYEAMDRAVLGQYAFGAFLLLMGLKIAATSLTLGSGGSGGVFAPSLFVGGMLGGAVGVLVNLVFPAGGAGSVGAYALVGMAGVVAGTTHAPVTAILLLFEMSGDYRMVLPLMITCVVASIVARNLKADSLYTVKLSRRGLMVRGGREVRILRALGVESTMDTHFILLTEAMPYREALPRMLGSPQRVFPVTDGQGLLTGAVVFDDVKESILEAGLSDIVVARDMVREDLPALAPGDDLDHALQVFAREGVAELVVAREGCPVGLLREHDVLAAYRKEVLRRQVE
jgi:CIC family chloride channel protein